MLSDFLARENINLEYIFLISAYILNMMALIGMVNTGLKTNNHLVWIFSIILMGLSAYIKYQKEKPIFKAIKYMNLGLIFTFFIGNALIGFYTHKFIVCILQGTKVLLFKEVCF